MGTMNYIPLIGFVVLVIAFVILYSDSTPPGTKNLYQWLGVCDVSSNETIYHVGCTCHDYWEIGGNHYGCGENPYTKEAGD